MNDRAPMDIAVGIEEITQAFEAAALADRLRFVEMLAPLHVARQDAKSAKSRDDKYTPAIKDFLALSGETELVDGERGIVAWLESRGGGHTYDLASLVQNEPDAALILLQCAVLMAVRLDDTIITRAQKGNGAGWIDTLLKYRMPGTGTLALRVGTVEEREGSR